MADFVTPPFYKKFPTRAASEEYANEMKDKLVKLGFDPKFFISVDEYDYRCSHRYYDYSEAYLDTDDEIIINALKMVI